MTCNSHLKKIRFTERSLSLNVHILKYASSDVIVIEFLFKEWQCNGLFTWLLFYHIQTGKCLSIVSPKWINYSEWTNRTSATILWTLPSTSSLETLYYFLSNQEIANRTSKSFHLTSRYFRKNVRSGDVIIQLNLNWIFIKP